VRRIASWSATAVGVVIVIDAATNMVLLLPLLAAYIGLRWLSR
jgi:hypothetical protein